MSNVIGSSPSPWSVAHSLEGTYVVSSIDYVIAEVLSPTLMIDAHMLSAAPDLVKACEALINYNTPDELEAAWLLARDAVLKAKGI